jgi:hypothetical protein
MQVTEAAEALAGFVRASEQTVALVKSEMAALRQRQSEVEARASWAREALREVVSRSGKRKVEAGPFAVSLNSGRERVDLVENFDTFDLPDDCKAVKVEPVKRAILARLKAGEKIPGATIGRGPDGVTIR